jgi:hypothetical protein
MRISLEKRLERIEGNLSNKKNREACDMTDDELIQAITGNPQAKADDLTIEQLEAMIREDEDAIKQQIATTRT